MENKFLNFFRWGCSVRRVGENRKHPLHARQKNVILGSEVIVKGRPAYIGAFYNPRDGYRAVVLF